MKNILSKIGKSLLIPTLALSMNTNDLKAQKLNIKPEISAGSGITNFSRFNVYSNWEDHFNGLDGDEKLTDTKMEKYADFQVGLNLEIKHPNFSWGIYSKYSITQAINEIPLAAIELHNWKFDYARVNEFFLKQTTPSIGIYVNFPVNENVMICLKNSLRQAKIVESKREDISLNNQLKCAPAPNDNTEDLTKEFENKKTKTLLNKIGLEIQISDDSGRLGIEGFYETDWKRINVLGLTGNIYFNLPKKKKDS